MPKLLDRLAVVSYVPSAQQAELLAELRSAGYETWVLDGTQIHDKASFLKAISIQGILQRATLTGWESFADAFSARLWASDSESIALVWKQAHHIMDGHLDDLTNALQILTQQSQDMRENHVQFATFLLGDGVGFHKK